MRDISADLKDRADFLREQMDAAQAQFDRHVDEIKREHQSNLKDLKADLDAVNLLMGAEQRRLGSTPAASKAPPQPREPKAQHPQPPKARPRMPITEVIGLQRAS